MPILYEVSFQAVVYLLSWLRLSCSYKLIKMLSVCVCLSVC